MRDDYLDLDHEPERASPRDSEALWTLARLLMCVALAVSATLAAQALTGAHAWAWWQVLSPMLSLPFVVVAAAVVRAYLPGHRA